VEITKEQIDQLKKAVGLRARDLRKKAGFSSVEKACKPLGPLDLSPTGLYELERGDNFLSPEMVIRLCAAYKAQPSELLPAESDLGILDSPNVAKRKHLADRLKVPLNATPLQLEAADLVLQLSDVALGIVLPMIKALVPDRGTANNKRKSGSSGA
jgi:transcriptional regulator with XRE-family HTH domain